LSEGFLIGDIVQAFVACRKVGDRVHRTAGFHSLHTPSVANCVNLISLVPLARAGVGQPRGWGRPAANIMLRISSGALFRPNMLRRLIATDSARISDRGGAIIRGALSGKEIHLPPAEGAVGPTATGIDTYKKAIYCPVSHILRTSTHVGTDDSGAIVKGNVGDGPGLVSTDEARVLAHNSALRLLSTIHHALDGDLSRVEQVLKLTGFVKGADDFGAHGAVINACSEVFIEAFGPDRGVGVRVCSGPGSLIGAVSCDVELRVRPPSGN
jgi:enamine deaminase RidA (YjgF/YER057c/UK114 family)